MEQMVLIPGLERNVEVTMPKKHTYIEMENLVLRAFNEGSKIDFGGTCYTIKSTGKPKTSRGEPKTDVYILLEDDSQNKKEIKISYKMENAHFIENKISDQRAKDIFGDNWGEIVTNATESLKDHFKKKVLFYPKKSSNTEAGSFTLGWRLDLINNDSGDLNCKLEVGDISEAYKGERQPNDKKNAKVNGQEVENSGVPNYMLIMNVDENTRVKEILNKLDKIDSKYGDKPLYATFRALNYRSCVNKTDGDRSLAVYINWTIEDEKLKASLVYNDPLKKKGNEVRDSLKDALDELQLEQKLLRVLKENISSTVLSQSGEQDLLSNTQP